MTTTVKAAIATGLVAAVFGGGFLTGRRGATTVVRDVQRHDAVTHTEVVQTTDAHVDQQSTQQRVEVAPKVVTRWRTVTVTAPDGTHTVTKEGERDHSADRVVTAETDRRIEDAHATKREVQTITVHDQVLHEVRIPAPLPRWLLGVQGGVSVPTLLGHAPDRSLLPFMPRSFAGALTVDVRVLGPFYVGVWASTAGAAGASLRVGL